MSSKALFLKLCLKQEALNAIETASVPEDVVLQISGLNEFYEALANFNREIATTLRDSLKPLPALEAIANINKEIANALQASIQPLPAIEAIANLNRQFAAALAYSIQPTPAIKAMTKINVELAEAMKTMLTAPISPRPAKE